MSRRLVSADAAEVLLAERGRGTRVVLHVLLAAIDGDDDHLFTFGDRRGAGIHRLEIGRQIADRHGCVRFGGRRRGLRGCGRCGFGRRGRCTFGSGRSCRRRRSRRRGRRCCRSRRGSRRCRRSRRRGRSCWRRRGLRNLLGSLRELGAHRRRARALTFRSAALGSGALRSSRMLRGCRLRSVWGAGAAELFFSMKLTGAKQPARTERQNSFEDERSRRDAEIVGALLMRRLSRLQRALLLH